MNDVSANTQAAPATALPCPYCKRPLKWRPRAHFTRGLFECDVCGSFPDFREQGAAREP